MIGAERAIAAGYAAFKRGDHDAARKALKGVGHAQAVHLLGLVEKAAGNVDAARGQLDKALRLDPSNPEVHNNRGLLARQMGDWPRAEAAFREALRLKPGFRSARLSLIRTLKQLDRLDEALREANGLLTANAADVDALILKAQIARTIRDLDMAVDAIGAALRLAPQNPFAHHVAASVELDRGQLQAAEKRLDQLVSGGFDRAEVRSLLARAHQEQGRLDAAERHGRQAFAMAPNGENLQFLADTYWMQGRIDAFNKLVDEALSQPATAIPGLDLMRKSGGTEAALDRLEKLAPAVQASLGGLSLRSALLLDLGRAGEAVDAARRADALTPDWRENHNLVRALLATGEAGEALALILKARAEDPLSQFWLAYEATALRALGDDRYHELIDYDQHVRAYTLPAPDGFASLETFNAALMETIDRLQLFSAHPLLQSLRSGSQSARDLTTVNDPVLTAYFEALDAPIRDYMEALGTSPDHPSAARNTGAYRIAGCWSVRLYGGGHHINHIHPRGWISSAYYVDVPAETRSGDGHAGWIKFGEPPMQTIPASPPEKWIQPLPGRLALFPSFLWHGTEPILDASRRVTAPFDVVPA
ncbi:MAG: tetratricopeptide repeat protein [Pseudomonadota bacterium]